MVNRTLPDGWDLSNINEIADFIRGVSYKKEDASDTPKKGLLPILRATNIQGDKLITNEDLVFVPEKYVKPEQLLKVGDVVVCMSSGSKHLVGKTAQLEKDWQGSFGTFCGGLRFKDNVNSKFGAYYFQSPYYREFIREKSSGININNLRFADFETLEISLPSLPEQEKIVNRIEELLSDLDAGVAVLERTQLGLQRYKASVLKAACEGKLLESREVENGELPEGWRWATVGEIGDENEQTVLTGPFGSNLGSEDFQEDGVPVLTIGCLTEQGLNLNKAKYISETKAKELERYRVREGDFLFSRMATVGRAGLVTKQFDGLIFNYHLMRLRLDVHKIDISYFLAYVRGSSTVTNYVRDVNHGATRDGINTKQLLDLPVALPPLEEQRRIVAEVERRLSVVREVEAAVEAGLVRAGRLRQSVLRSAFEGRL